jgi:hypothetical protein
MPVPEVQSYAPRTAQVMGREKIRSSQQGVLDAAAESQIRTRGMAAEGMRTAVRGMESGTGARVAAQRRAAQELADQQATQDVGVANLALDFAREDVELGDIQSDRMLKTNTYGDLIQKLYDEGKDASKIGDQIQFWIDNEPDPVVVAWLKQRGVGYTGAFAEEQGIAVPKKDAGFGEKLERGLESAFSFIPGVGD